MYKLNRSYMAIIMLFIVCLCLTSISLIAQEEDENTESIFDMATANAVVLRRNWQFTDPGAVVFHDGMFHMFQNAFNGWPAESFAYHSTSEDGITWERATSIFVFDASDVPYAGLTALVTSALVEDDGTWVIYYYTLDNSASPWEGAIGRATAEDPNGPWIADPEPVLTAGSEGSWDSFHVAHPSVIRTEDGYVMYYTGRTTDTVNIGMATSEDGIEWTRYDNPETTDTIYAESDPLFAPIETEADTNFAMQPQAVQTEDGWAMVLRRAIGYGDFGATLQIASSDDGIEWAISDMPPITRFDADGNAIWFTEFVYVDGVYYLFIEVGNVEPGFGNTTQIYLSTFEDELPDF